MTQINKFRYTELYTWETENTNSFPAHIVYCQKLTMYYIYQGSLDKFRIINLTQIMFSDYNALIIEINNKKLLKVCMSGTEISHYKKNLD